MILFHTTDQAEAILRNGLRDTPAPTCFPSSWPGFLADGPIDVNEGATGDQVLAVELPNDMDLDYYELVEDGKPYREWCIPAALIATNGSVGLLSEDSSP